MRLLFCFYKMVTINIGRKEMVFFGAIILVFAVVGMAVAQWDNSKAMFHDSEDVKITIGGTDYSLQNASDLGLLGGGTSFGESIVRSLGTVYLAEDDGMVNAYVVGSNNAIYGYVGLTNNPSTKIAQDCGYSSATGDEKAASITFSVRKGYYYKITGVATQITWTPLA